jgi:wyosine [tRNA(Phe)-imidazoG37] synthetase (radical SAM superfamily)
VYCEIGITGKEGLVSPDFRISLPPTLRYRSELISILTHVPHLDSITFGYNGEPTLNENLLDYLKIASEVRNKISWKDEKPKLTLFTNASTLYSIEIRDRVKRFEVVLAKLDVATDDDFRRINRPHTNVLNIDRIIDFLVKLKNEMPNSHHLVIQSLIVNSYRDDFQPNNNPLNINKLAHALKRIKPDLVQIYSTARIPAEYFVYAIDEERKKEIVNFIKEIVQDNSIQIEYY